MPKSDQHMWELIHRYILGECSEDEHRTVEQWMDEARANRKVVTDLQEIWRLAPGEDFQVNAKGAWEQFRQNHIEQDASAVKKLKHKRPSRNMSWKGVLYRAAAVILIAALTGFLSWQYMPHPHPQEQQTALAMQKLATKRGNVAQVTFSDGTIVTLNAAGTLRFPKVFKGPKREVYLNGEAFFKVAHEQDRPFIVHTSNGAVKVLGTQFDVQAWKGDKRSVVGVKQGKVAVFPSDSLAKKSPHIFLTNGQAVTIEKGHLGPVRKVDMAYLMLWRSGGMYFNDTPFADVAKRIERRFDVQVKIQNPDLKDVPFTGTFKDAGLNEVLKVVDASMGIHYTRKDSTIVFRSTR